MAISFPRLLPTIGWVKCDFLLDDPVKASASGANLINYTQIEDPAWTADLATQPLLYDQYSEIEAWWLSLREGLRSVLFRHPTQGYPKAHRDNRAPADDPGNLISVTDGNVLSVNGVGAALVLSVGDRIGLERAGRYYVGRLSDVSGTGTARSITVEPPPFDSVAQAGAIVRFANPTLVMRPVPKSFQAPREGLFCTVSFQLRESQ
ncbi:hypothetical protein J2W42_002198 [Rhizobium tibeticum]|uniref:hypothetical protein n=1 Tax=Rhizobium tibeticum TaxID=501024 RepID=UPI0027884777|nr:hypothetical protein [Rhizobium tibeticum]MDP9809350.1 hypothetical protein [Rhizobium tibeticum]